MYEPTATAGRGLLLQLSDLHLGASEGEPDRRLERAVGAAARLRPRPEAVLLSGDVADEPTAESYERAHRIVSALGLPVHAIPGNHDDRDLLARRFGGRESASGEPVHVLAYVGGLRLVGCDTTVPGSAAGSLPSGQLDWLSRGAVPGARAPDAARPPPSSGRERRSRDGRDRAPAGRGGGARVAARGPPTGSRRHLRARAPHGLDRVRGAPAADLPEHQLGAAPRPPREQALEFVEEPLGFAVHLLDGGRLVSHIQPFDPR